ncbi:zinc finger MYM-type protein 6-like [Misgurnus anguillicaudatus]|uniref:zinc finger MYM-type protein 6-like n=1 Tax=Misgurnus anguillicaudatus TaxID=75329 RepID=UPI003CCF001C
MDRFVVYKDRPHGSSTSSKTTGANPDVQGNKSTADAAPAKRKRDKLRKYSDTYLKFGFTYKDTDGIELPMCVICSDVLSNECMKPSKLQRRLETNHGHLRDKPLEYFQASLRTLRGQQTIMKKSAKIGELALKASYKVALRIAQSKKPYTVAEDLILPAAIDMCNTIFGNDDCGNKLKTIPLSDTTIARRVDEMASDVRAQLMEKLKMAEAFALQLDETTDISKDAQLLAFVRFADQNEMQEEFLFCKPLPERTTSSEIFKAIDEFFRENDIPWAKCIALCTDGARSMAGLKSGLIALVRQVVPDVLWTHCMLHRESLVAKELSVEFADVMESVVKAVNFIKRSALQTRLFAALCEAAGEEHTTLLYHSDVRWLSRGSVLSRVFELRASIHEFLRQHCTDLAAKFNDKTWLTQLAYLADVFSELNRLNKSMQGCNTHAIQLYDKMDSLQKKIKRWRDRVREGTFSMFPSVDELGDSADLSPQVTRLIIGHLEALERQFGKYFSEAESWRRDKTWIQFPFKDNASNGSNLTVTEEDQLIDLSTDSTHKHMYETRPLTQFWIFCQKTFPQLAKKAMMSLLPFATTYLCESAFSSLSYLKSKYRSKLQPESDMMLCLTSISPRIDRLCAVHQGQSSH